MKLITLILCILVIGCTNPIGSILEPVKAITQPDKGITAQVGKENTKQAVGITAKKETVIDDNKGTVSQGKVVVSQAEKAEVTTNTGSSTGSITAQKVTVTNTPVSLIVGIVLGVFALVLLFLYMLLKRRTGGSNEQDS